MTHRSSLRVLFFVATMRPRPSIVTSDPHVESRSGLGPRDGVLVAAARAGERWAQEALVRRHTPAVQRLAGRLMGNREDRDDLIQDTFVLALTKLRSLDDADAFGPWVRSIVIRTGYKRLRRRRLLARLGLRRREEVDLTQVAGTDLSGEQAAELTLLYARLRRLPADEETAYILRVVEGMQISEIAAATRVSEATVKRRIRAADALVKQERGGSSR